MNCKIFVIGSTGFVGVKVLHQLLKRQCQLGLLYRSEKTFSEEFKHIIQYNCESINMYKGDVLDMQSLKSCKLEQYHSIIYLACNSKWGTLDCITTRAVSYDGVSNIMHLMHKNQRLIYISSATAMLFDDNFFSKNKKNACYDGFIYAKAKYDTEQLIINKCSNYVILRPGEIYDKNDNQMITAQNIQDYMRNLAFCIHGGVSICNRLQVADCIANCCFVTKKLNKIYFLGGDNITIAQLARCVQKSSGNGHLLFFFNTRLALFFTQLLKFFKVKLFEYEAIKYGQFDWFVSSNQAAEDLDYKFSGAEVIIDEVVQYLQQK